MVLLESLSLFIYIYIYVCMYQKGQKENYDMTGDVATFKFLDIYKYTFL